MMLPRYRYSCYHNHNHNTAMSTTLLAFLKEPPHYAHTLAPEAESDECFVCKEPLADLTEIFLGTSKLSESVGDCSEDRRYRLLLK
jgi:hypothetical protein